MDFADNVLRPTVAPGASSNSNETEVIYAFDEFRIDTARFELSRGGEPLPVEPQVLELLIMLIDHRDHVVSRDDLLEKIWKGRVVSDTTLSSRIKTARQIIGDDGARQRYIKTIHGRGFRFVGQVGVTSPLESATEKKDSKKPVLDRPATHYARSGDIHIAYHLFGQGPANLVLTPGFVSHIDNYWDDPNLASWLGRFGELARVAIFDKRGTGMSDRVSSLPGMDERMDDVRAVMDAAGFDTAFIMGVSEGGSLATLFAAHHPERCDGLVLYGSFARFEYWFPDDASLQMLFDYIESAWGTGQSLPQFAPSMASDPSFLDWWGKFERLGATPGAAVALMKMNSQIDISGILASVRVPTLVIHRSDDVLIDVAGGRALAEQIPSAQYVELSGSDHLPWVGDNRDGIVDVVATFIGRSETTPISERVLATILLVRIDDESDRDAAQVDTSVVQQELRRFRASRIDSHRYGVVAVFDGPGRALECAVSLSRLLAREGIEHGIGAHAGEVPSGREALWGTAVDISVNVAEQARNGEILISRTLNDLVAGSEVVLEDRGEFHLPAINQDWRLFKAMDTK